MYEENEFELSKEFLLKAAESNHAKSLYMLGIIYQEQKGLTKEELKESDIIAHKYFNAAFHSGYWPLSCYDGIEFVKKVSEYDLSLAKYKDDFIIKENYTEKDLRGVKTCLLKYKE